MPRYTFKCLKCEALTDFTYSLAEAPRVGGKIKRSGKESCSECSGKTFSRVWGEKSAPFRMNFRRTSPL